MGDDLFSGVFICAGRRAARTALLAIAQQYRNIEMDKKRSVDGGALLRHNMSPTAPLFATTAACIKTWADTTPLFIFGGRRRVSQLQDYVLAQQRRLCLQCKSVRLSVCSSSQAQSVCRFSLGKIVAVDCALCFLVGLDIEALGPAGHPDISPEGSK